MAEGIMIWDAAGNLQVAPDVRLTRILGTVNSGVVAGSVTVANFVQGTPFFHFVPRTGYSVKNRLFPDVSISGTTLSWTFPAADANSEPWPTDILYGVY